MLTELDKRKLREKLNELDQQLFATIEIAREIIYNSNNKVDEFRQDEHYQAVIAGAKAGSVKTGF